MLGNLLQQQFGQSRDWPFGSAIATLALLLLAAFLLLVRLVQGNRKVECE
jgi:spermidine/putrescine transport system permease protein